MHLSFSLFPFLYLVLAPPALSLCPPPLALSLCPADKGSSSGRWHRWGPGKSPFAGETLLYEVLWCTWGGRLLQKSVRLWALALLTSCRNDVVAEIHCENWSDSSGSWCKLQLLSQRSPDHPRPQRGPSRQGWAKGQSERGQALYVSCNIHFSTVLRGSQRINQYD